MSSYLSSSVIQQAVQHLGRSNARSRIGDYLIVKRAIVRQGGSKSVELSERNEHWTDAIRDLARIAVAGEWAGPPYFNPFGAARDTRTAGYRTEKFISNGSSNTVMDWHGRGDSPVERVPPMKPAHVRILESQDPESLRRWFHVASRGAGSAPRILDAAIWWLRGANLDELADANGGHVTKEALVGRFRDEVGLTAIEETVLFASAYFDELGSNLELEDRPAPPVAYLPAPLASATRPQQQPPPTPGTSHTPTLADKDQHGSDHPADQRSLGDLDNAVRALVAHIEAKGFSFQPWQVAAFVTAVRTKPLVLLAGISGTGKTALPGLVAEATRGISQTIAVRPDWTDSAELLGRFTLNERFVPGSLLRASKEAAGSPTREIFFVLDEMNIARVEYYMAEVLSRIEERKHTSRGPTTRQPLSPDNAPEEWAAVHLPPNLAIIGSVNMDESTHDFSRKVMDRAFIIEFSDIDLNAVPEILTTPPDVGTWPANMWVQKHLRLADLDQAAHGEMILRTIGALSAVNQHLAHAQLQVGYRVRDEVAMFCINAKGCISSFEDHEGTIVDPLDLAISMKVLPRILGGEATLRRVLTGLLRWATGRDDQAEERTGDLELATHPEAAAGEADADSETKHDVVTESTRERYPICAKRIQMMLDRLDDSGYASYWT